MPPGYPRIDLSQIRLEIRGGSRRGVPCGLVLRVLGGQRPPKPGSGRPVSSARLSVATASVSERPLTPPPSGPATGRRNRSTYSAISLLNSGLQSVMRRFFHDPVENLCSGGVRERCFHHLSKRFDEFAHRGPIIMSIGGDIRLPVGRVSIRFEVCGGFRRRAVRRVRRAIPVSIRFEVRGGSRPPTHNTTRRNTARFNPL